MVHPQRTCSHMELLPLVCLCLLSCSGTTSADPAGTVVVKQDDDVILPCSIDGVNMETVLFDWKKDGQTKKEVFLYNNGDVYHKRPDAQDPQFRGRVSHFQEELKHGNASIKITNARMDDSGDYTCDFPRDSSLETVNVKLVVDRVLKDRTGENIPGAAPEPSVTILDETDDWALLQCKAHGVPDLEVHWQDSDGNKLPAEEPQVLGSDHKYITLNTTVTKTGHFSCVATQMNISHRISSQIYVHFHEADITGLIVGAIVGTLLVAAVVFGVVFYMREQKHKRELREKDRIIEGSRRDTERSDNPAEIAALKSPA